MSGLELLSKGTFVASLLLIVYIVYFEWKSAKVNAEKDEIKLGEKDNEDQVASLDDTAVIDLVNKEFGTTSSPPKPEPTSPVSGSPDANGDPKAIGNKKS